MAVTSLKPHGNPPMYSLLLTPPPGACTSSYTSWGWRLRQRSARPATLLPPPRSPPSTSDRSSCHRRPCLRRKPRTRSCLRPATTTSPISTATPGRRGAGTPPSPSMKSPSSRRGPGGAPITSSRRDRETVLSSLWGTTGGPSGSRPSH